MFEKNESVGLFPDKHIFFHPDDENYIKYVIKEIDIFKEKCIKKGISKIVDLGDIINRGTALKEIELYYIDKIYDDKRFMFYYVQGNHELFFKNNNKRTVLNFLKRYKNIKFIQKPTKIGRCCFIPYIDDTKDLKKQASELIDSMEDDGEMKWVFGHFEFSDFIFHNGIKSRSKKDEFLKIKLLGKKNVNVVSGHYHRRTCIDNINYVGMFFQSHASANYDLFYSFIENEKIVYEKNNNYYYKTIIINEENKDNCMELLDINFKELKVDVVINVKEDGEEIRKDILKKTGIQSRILKKDICLNNGDFNKKLSINIKDEFFNFIKNNSKDNINNKIEDLTKFIGFNEF